MKSTIKLHVNYADHEVTVAPYVTLSECLREELGLKGVRVSCNQRDCSACTVLLDGDPVYSCMMLAVEAGEEEEVISATLSFERLRQWPDGHDWIGERQSDLINREFSALPLPPDPDS